MGKNSQSSRVIGLFLGLSIFGVLLLLPAPANLTPQGQKMGAVAVLMALWWLTEAIPIAATAFLPLFLFPALGILDMGSTCLPYASPMMFLFVGGFMVAMAMQKWNLHRRLCLGLITRVGGGPRRVLASFMVATALASMWISNTATAVMMLPIAMALLQRMEEKEGSRFGLVLLLGIAYSASVGGTGTLVGTPTNVIFAGQAPVLFPDLVEIDFFTWMRFALPTAVGFLIIIWFYLAFVVGRLGTTPLDKATLRQELREMGPWSRGEAGVGLVFLLMAIGWALPKSILPLHDGTVAMGAALLLFIIPVRIKQPEFLLDWKWAEKIPWGILFLLGGGFALAKGFKETGLDTWVAGGLGFLQGYPPFLLILLICLGVSFLTELTSNTSTASMLMPVLGAVAVSIEVHPYLLMIPAAMTASFAFMLPVATPPNAIVFGSGKIRIPEMARTGLALNLLGALWVSLLVYFLASPLLDLN